MGCAQHPSAKDVTNIYHTGSGESRKLVVEMTCSECGATTSKADQPDPE